jgi:hypothetical protein
MALKIDRRALTNRVPPVLNPHRLAVSKNSVFGTISPIPKTTLFCDSAVLSHNHTFDFMEEFGLLTARRVKARHNILYIGGE